MAVSIKLDSTSNHQNYLKQLARKDKGKSNTYLLVTEIPECQLRVSKDVNHASVIYWVDPPGGPRISLGEPVRGVDLGKVKYIDRIKDYGYVITFEDDLSRISPAENSES